MSFWKGDESLDFEDSFLSSQEKHVEAIENISMPAGCDDSLNFTNFTENPTDSLHSSKLFDINFSLNCTDYLSKAINEGLKGEGRHDEDLQCLINEYKTLLNEVSVARNKRNASNFVVETMNDIFKNSSKLSANLKKKCLQRMQHTRLLRDCDNFELLKAIGVDGKLEPFTLTVDEKNTIRSELKEELDRKARKQKVDNDVVLDLLGNVSKSVLLPGSTITEDNVAQISLINEIGKAINSCFEVACSISSTIKEIRDCHVQKFQKLYEEEMNCLSSRTKLLELKLKNLNSVIENAVIEDHDSINQAVDLLHKKLKTILDESEYSLQKMESMKEAYDSLKGTNFDSILREYREVREIMKHKLWALEQIQKSE